MPATALSSAQYMNCPFTETAFATGWQVAAIVQAQSGNPVTSSLRTAPSQAWPILFGPMLPGPSRLSAASIVGSTLQCLRLSRALAIWVAMWSSGPGSTTSIFRS